MDRPRLDVEIYQIVDDSMLKQNRSDGTGWDWSWAEWQRDWMDATPHRYAYRCLPLTIMNQTGWWIRNPVGFTATWRGQSQPGTIDFRFDAAPDTWDKWINCQFGEGIITWNTPFLFRTRPAGSRLLICGPANYFKAHVQPLSALIESDWITMSFTMNWKIMVADQPIRFELGEPLFQAIPLASNVCADLEDASVLYQRLRDNPELLRAYKEWDQGRRQFHERKVSGDVKPNDWQKDYFQGRDAIGLAAPGYHMTKVKPPHIRINGPAGEPPRASSLAPVAAGPVAWSEAPNGNGTTRRASLPASNPGSKEQTPEMFQFQVCLNMATAALEQVSEQMPVVTNPSGDADHRVGPVQHACPMGTAARAGQSSGHLSTMSGDAGSPKT